MLRSVPSRCGKGCGPREPRDALRGDPCVHRLRNTPGSQLPRGRQDLGADGTAGPLLELSWEDGFRLPGEAAPSCAWQRPEVHFLVVSRQRAGDVLLGHPHDGALGLGSPVRQGGPQTSSQPRSRLPRGHMPVLTGAVPSAGGQAEVFQKQSNCPGSVQWGGEPALPCSAPTATCSTQICIPDTQ